MGYVGLKLIQQAINISKIPMYQEQNFTHCLLHDKTAESLHKVLEFRESSHLEDIKIEQLLPDADTKLSLSYILYVKMISTDFFYEYSLVQNKYLSFLYALLEKTTEGEIKDISDLTNHVVYKNLGSTVHKQMKDWANTIYKEKRNINSNFSCKSAFSNSNLALVQKEQRPLEKKILPVAPTVRVASDANYAPSLQQVMIHNDESDPQISMVNKKMTPDSGVLIINEDEFTKLLDMDDKYKKLILNALKPSQ
uniref:CSN8_PSD8_EIF3K domain-containing protein n=1 Tax=Parastrongyloides trichosuri TaxID=131310 RepID=A0A0N4ZD75_PARTI